MVEGTQGPPSDEELASGTMVGEYQITGKLGQGGMGSVYRVVHPIIGKKAAVKVIGRELSLRTDATQRFIQEAQAVNRIAHPNIVDIFSLGTLPDGRPYFVMELLDGESLGSRLRRGRVSLEEASAILVQICAALEATHQQGIIHRDLKPDNVFIDRRSGRETVKLLDFGIAKLNRADDEPGLTRDGSAMGTPAYLSPELARGKKVDRRSDIYSLGVIAFEMILGRCPFAAPSAIDLIMLHVSTPAPPPRSLWPDIPVDIDKMLTSMLDKDPTMRPPLADVRAVFAPHAGVLETPPPSTGPIPDHRDHRPASLAPTQLPATNRPTSASSPSTTAAGRPSSSSGPSIPAASRPSASSGASIAGASAPASGYKCKGSHVVMAARVIDERLGAGTFKDLVKHHGEPWNGLLLPMTWFEVDPLVEALSGAGVRLGMPVEELTREIARLNALEDLTTMYRFFLRIAAPQRVMGFTPRLWGTYVAFGEAKAIQNEPGNYVGECTGIPRRLLDWTCGAWRGFVPTAIEVAGGKEVRGTIRGTWPMGHDDLYRLECAVTYR